MRNLWKNYTHPKVKYGQLFLLVTLLLSLVSSVFTQSFVSASSTYDNTYNHTDVAYLEGGAGSCSSTDVTASISTFLEQDASYFYANSAGGNFNYWNEMLTGFQNVRDNNRGVISLVQVMNMTNNQNEQVQLFWHDDTTSNPYQWTSPTTFGNLFSIANRSNNAGSHTYTSIGDGMTFIFNGSCDLVVSGVSDLGGTYGIPISNDPTAYGTSNQKFTSIDLVDFNEPIDYNYPAGYDGPVVNPVSPDPTTVYPTINITTDQNNTVKLRLDPSFLTRYSLPVPDQVIFTLENSTPTIIDPTILQGPYPTYENLPDGVYTAYLDVVYYSDGINESYIFPTTEFKFTANHTAYSIIYNGAENKYCSVRSGYEWNCDISQPEDDEHLPVDGAPSEWTPETCESIADLQGCVNNVLHYLGEYLGINGPSVGQGSSPFLQFETNTFGLTSIITAPISILTNLSTASYTCEPVELPLPFLSTDLELPCMGSYYTTYLGDLYTLWQTVINGLVAYWVVVNLLKMVKDAKDPQKDQIEVLNL